MSNEYVEKHVSEIMDDQSLPFPKKMALASAWMLGNQKGVNLKILDVTQTSSLSDFYVLVSANNTSQANSMADTLTSQLKRRGHKVYSKEGFYLDSDWFLIDMGDVIIHIFLDFSREAYNLDNLWEESTSIEIPQSYYFEEEALEAVGFSETEAEAKAKTETKDYF